MNHKGDKVREAETIVMPGLVDMHVHLREPGAEYKENFISGTYAALAGGVVAAFDMPNNVGENRVTRLMALVSKIDLARKKIYVDTGFYFGSDPEDDNTSQFAIVQSRSCGLKLYLEETTCNDKQYEPEDFREIIREWHRVATPTQPIILHAEGRTIETALGLAAGESGHPTHVAHVSNRAELEAVMAAKRKGWPVTCGVTPHHLFMTDEDVKHLGWYARMKPPLASQEDQDFLWANLDAIDVFETDHAPHTKDEKDEANKDNPDADPDKTKYYGVPGLEAMLPLLLQAVVEGRLTPRQLIDKASARPATIMGLRRHPGTSVKVRMEQYEFGEEHIMSKCSWSPYVGRLVTGKVVQVDLRGEVAYRSTRPMEKHSRLGKLLFPFTP